MKVFSCASVLMAVLILSGLLPSPPTVAARSHPGADVQSYKETAEPGTKRHDESISFAERVAHQSAIEEIYASHRRGPAISARGPELKVVAEHKVIDSLLHSVALELNAGTTLTPSDLQAEMDRMAGNTRAAERLEELFAALNHDPMLIAECLARPVLAERRLRAWHAFDRRLHEDTRIRAESLRACLATGCSAAQTGVVATSVVYQLHTRGKLSSVPSENDFNAVELTAKILNQYKESFSPPGRLGRVEETAHDFRFARTNRVEQDSLSVQYFVLPKKGFDEWWEEQGGEIQPNLLLVDGDAQYELPSISKSRASCAWIPQDPDPIPTINGAPSPRYVPSVVWTGSEMIVWGGNADSITNTGGRYDPATDSWSETSTQDAPTARTQHSAVWAQTEMIVWGGISNTSTLLKDGKRYDPATNTWTNMTTPGFSVSSRRRHRAVWTGTEMIVWGGYGSSGYLNKGGRYHPESDSWQPTDHASAPSPRSDHTAVWTGTEMIVWGGYSGSYFNTGGRYDPGSDQWTDTLVDQAPVGRYSHVAVWTGDEMIVWGGAVSGGYTDTGGIYSFGLPEGESWSDTTPEGAPAGRDAFSGVWTGDQLIIWGGWIVGGPTQTGGIYTFSDDSWEDTPLDDAPEACYSHRAVWADDMMISWGGTNAANAKLNTGGIFNCQPPALDPPSLIRMTRDPGSSTGYYLYVTKVTDATGYNLYEGSLGTWYDHGTGAQCDVAWEDLDTEVRSEITPQELDSYYLVTAKDENVESGSGYTSSGVERDPDQNTCPP